MKLNDFPIVTAHKSENDTQAKGIKLITERTSNTNTTANTVDGFTKKRTKKKNIEKIREGTAILTTIASNKNKSCEIPKKIEVTQEDINASPIIAVNNVSDGKLIHKEDILKINALGLIDKGRVEDKKDSVVYFSGNRSDNNDKTDYQLNTDYIIQNSLYLFAIYYVKESSSYMINFYHNFGNNNLSFYKGYQLFSKVSHDFPVKITSKEVIKIGDLVLELIPLQEGLLNVVNVSNKNAKVVFHPDKKKVTIGRGRECNLCSEEEKNISKIQATLNYLSTFGCWCLKDGDEEKESTNGTWLYALNEYPLFDGMMIAVKNEQLEITVDA